jgi:hypothetical protein
LNGIYKRCDSPLILQLATQERTYIQLSVLLQSRLSYIKGHPTSSSCTLLLELCKAAYNNVAVFFFSYKVRSRYPRAPFILHYYCI